MLIFLSLLLSGCRHADRAALLALYDALGGASWLHNTNWSPAADPCGIATRWYGVGVHDPCDRWRDGDACAVGRITSLYLEGNGLLGDLGNWTQFGVLSNLSLVDFSWNDLLGTVPTELGGVRNLIALELSHNRISGTLPTELGILNSGGGAVALRELRLSHNSLSGVLPSALSEHVQVHSHLLLASARLEVSPMLHVSSPRCQLQHQWP